MAVFFKMKIYWNVFSNFQLANKRPMFRIMAMCQTSYKPLSKLMMVWFTDVYMHHAASVGLLWVFGTDISWWRHQMETFTALLAICARNSTVPGEFPAQRPVTRRFDIYFDLRPNKRLSKQSWGWWLGIPSRPLWRHRNVTGNPSTWARWKLCQVMPCHYEARQEMFSKAFRLVELLSK